MAFQGNIHVFGGLGGYPQAAKDMYVSAQFKNHSWIYIMRFGGLQKTTTMDFPGVVSALVFTQGCNFTCPYCHNPALTHAEEGSGEAIAEDDVLAFLTQRKKLLDGVVISGGEPTLQPDLPRFCQQLKALGYAVKLDTNGSRPAVLETLLAEALVDYVALDVKTAPKAYAPDISPFAMHDALARCVDLLEKDGVAHEFRTTCVFPFVTSDSMHGMGRLLQGTRSPWFLQPVRLNREGAGKVLTPEFFAEIPGNGLPSQADMDAFAQVGREYVAGCVVR